jgi:hypothetical protein
MTALIDEMEASLRDAPGAGPAAPVAEASRAALAALRGATTALLRTLASRPDAGMAVSVPYLKLCGYVAGGWLLARSALIAAGEPDAAEREFYAAKLHTAAFYAAQVLPLAHALARVVTDGGASVVATDAALI